MSAASFGELSDPPFARTLSDIAQGHYARKTDRHHSRMRKAWQDMIDHGELRWHVIDEFGEVFDGGEIPLPRFDGGISEFSYDHEVEAPWYHHWGRKRTYAADLEGRSDHDSDLQARSRGCSQADNEPSGVSYGSESHLFVEERDACAAVPLADVGHYATEANAIECRNRLER